MRGALKQLGFVFLATWAADAAADLVVYDDALQNTFQDYSYGGGTVFNNINPVHSGADSIAFTGNNSFNAISFFHSGGVFGAGTYSSLRFFVDGGAAGSQQIYLMLESGGATVLPNPVLLNPYIAGGSIPANSWAQVDVPFSALTFNNDGSFDRIDIQNANGTSQPTLYIDDVSLVASGGASADNYLFGDSFEPEYMFVPQFNNSSIKVYQRTTNSANFVFVREAPLGQPAGAGVSIRPNAVAFAPDGGLWVVDSGGGDPGNSMLWRYTLQSMLTDANPAPAVHIGPTAGGGLYDLAFYGSNGYVSSDSGVLKFPLSSLNAGGNPAPAVLSSGAGATPVGLAFDTQGRLWVCNIVNYNVTGNTVRMTTTGTIEVTLSNNIINPEGIAFDEYGSLWVGRNQGPTLYGFGSSQITASGTPTPIGQIDTYDVGPNGSSGFAGGIAFDRHGDMRVNYEYDQSVRAYTVTAAPSGGPYTSYTTTELTPLSGATTDPGRGGIAIWPVPHTVHR